MGEVYDPAFPTGDDEETPLISTELDAHSGTDPISECPLDLQEAALQKLDKKEIALESENKSLSEEKLQTLALSENLNSTEDFETIPSSLLTMRKTRRLSNHSIKEQDCDSNSSKSLKDSSDSSNQHDTQIKPDSSSKEELPQESNANHSDSEKKQNEDSNISDNQLSDSNSDSSKKKASKVIKDDEKVPTRRSTRIKSIVEKKEKQQSPKDKTHGKKKETISKDETKKDQNKKDILKKSKGTEKSTDKNVDKQNECHSPEKQDPLVPNTHIENNSLEKVDINSNLSSIDKITNDNCTNEHIKAADSLKSEIELEKENIKKEEEGKLSSPEKIEPICSPLSPIPNGNETHEFQTVKEEAKPVKVKSRWWRNCELEQGDAPNSTTSESTPVEQPSPRPSPLEQYSHLKDFPVFEHLEENVYLFERKRSKGKKEVRRMLCDCSLTKEEKERQEPGCGEDCLNRLLMIECGSRCVCGDLCTNKRFQMRKYAPIEPFKTLKKGWGLRAKESIPAGQFVLEYVGEVLDASEFRQRVKFYAKRDGPNAHYYFMALRADEIIDATSRGNLSRFINHSCDPNCETQKWTVNGELRVGFFTTRRVPTGEELTFDYQFQRYGREAQKCFCGASNCRGFIGEDNQVELKSYSKTKDQPAKKKKEKKELEDLIWEEELERLSSGLRNREQTLTLSRLMVRAEDLESRMQLLDILQNTTETGCLRLFLDYHGLSLIWSWMVSGPSSLALRSKVLSVLTKLPISHKTMLIDSKVLDVVHRWSRDDSSDQGTDDDEGEDKETLRNAITSNASSLMASWTDLKEIFRIPRLEKQKRREDERELDRKSREYNRRLKEQERARSRSHERRRSYSPDHRHSSRSSHDYDHSEHSHRDNDYKKRRDHDKYRHNDYTEWKDSPRKSKSTFSSFKRNKYDQKYDDEEHKPKKRPFVSEKQIPTLSKEERRHRFALEVQQKEEEEALRKTFENFEQEQYQYQMEQQDQYQYQQEMGQGEQFQQDQFEQECYEQDQFKPNQTSESFYAYPPPPFNPAMPPPSLDGNHYEYEPSAVYNIPPPSDGTQIKMPPPAPIQASPIQTPQQPPPILPPLNVPPPNFAPPPPSNPIPSEQPPIVYYPPSTSQIPPPALPPPAPSQTLPPPIPPSPQVPLLPPPNPAPLPVPATHTNFLPPTYASSQQLLTQHPPPTQPHLPSQQQQPPSSLPHLPPPQQQPPPNQQPPPQMQAASLPHQQPVYYIPPASAEPNALAATILRLATLESPSPVVVPPPPAKLPQNWRTAKDEDGNIYYYHTVTRQTQWDPPSLVEEDHGTPTVDEHRPSRRQRSTTTAAADTSSEVAKKIKELFRTKMSTHIVQCLNPFRKPDCKLGRIISTEDFKHLARKLTHYVMSKELKHCRNVEDLECNENVKHKAKDFVHKYMAKYGDVYRKDKSLGASPLLQDD